jgi:hypothetical protein
MADIASFGDPAAHRACISCHVKSISLVPGLRMNWSVFLWPKEASACSTLLMQMKHGARKGNKHRSADNVQSAEGSPSPLTHLDPFAIQKEREWF